MQQTRIWTDPAAEAEFWRHMAQLEEISAGRADRRGLWWKRFLRHGGATGDADAIRRQAQELVRLHTTPAEAEVDVLGPTPEGSETLRTLAGLAVSLRQDRLASEDEAVQSTS